MQFIKQAASGGVEGLGSRLQQELTAGKRVLWLIAGGSNIPLTVAIMAALPDELTAELTIMPADERFGLPGHPDSNAHQLLEAGFQPKLARFIPILTGDGLHATATQYNTAAAEALAGAAVIAQLGMGADGHIAGILPHSAACEVTDRLVTAYEGPDYTRLTFTFPGLRRIDTAYVFAYGSNKREALVRLRGEDVPLAEQPAQILKALPSAYVYNDQLEGE